MGFPSAREDRRDCVRNFLGQRNLDEDQRLVDQCWMKEAVATPVRRVDPRPQIVPVSDLGALLRSG
jgi:hypothetical protein